MADSDVLVMVCNSCQQENTIHQNRRTRRSASCSFCDAVLFEMDDISENYRITKNFRIYYRSLSDTLHDIQVSLARHSEEIRKMCSAGNGQQEELWKERIRVLFEPETENILETTISLLENENRISDLETRESARDFLDGGRELLEMIRQLETQDDLLASLGRLKSRTRDIHEFAKMFNMYLGEQSSYERKLGL